MDPDLRKELDEIHALTRDNHRMLRAIRRDQWLAFIGKILFWLIALAIPLYVYQQYLEPIISKFSQTTGVTVSGPFGLPSSAEVQKLLNSFKGATTTP